MNQTEDQVRQEAVLRIEARSKQKAVSQLKVDLWHKGADLTRLEDDGDVEGLAQALIQYRVLYEQVYPGWWQWLRAWWDGSLLDGRCP